MSASSSAQAAPQTGASATLGARCRFHLLAQPGLSSFGGARWQHTLLMSSCDPLGAPAQVACSPLLALPHLVANQLARLLMTPFKPHLLNLAQMCYFILPPLRLVSPNDSHGMLSSGQTTLLLTTKRLHACTPAVHVLLS